MTRFIHTADWQLGMTRHFLSPQEQARYSQAQLDVVAEIGDLARVEGCEFVLVCGDVFESNQLDRQVLARALDALSAVGVPVYLLPGNHDPANAASIYTSPTFTRRCPVNVHVLGREPVVLAGGSAAVFGAPWDSKHPLADLVADACERIDTAVAPVRILAGHGAVDVLSPDDSDRAVISLARIERALGSGAAHYVALGDRHSTTAVGSSGRVWYSGAPLATDFGESDPGNVLLVDVEGARISVEPRRVGGWRFVARTFDVNSAQDVATVAAWLAALENKRTTVLKLSFVGTVSLAAKSQLEEELERAGDLFASLDTWERRTELAVTVDEGDLQELALSGFAAGVLEDLQRISGTGGEDGESARDALGLLYRLSGAGR